MDAERYDCRERIVSEQYLDFIFDFDIEDVIEFLGSPDYCVQHLSDNLQILHVAENLVPSLSAGEYGYNYVPKCYGLLAGGGAGAAAGAAVPDLSALSAAGILQAAGEPLSLTGRSVLIGIIDTGIRYRLPEFRRSDGTTRIYRLWDQTSREGTPPQGFFYGAEFTEEDINANLFTEGSGILVTDESGHGTKVAGVSAGCSVDNGFVGAAPDALFAVVKLKEAKQYLREFYEIPDGIPCYQETDILMALQYLDRAATALRYPLVICIAFGTAMGSHDGASLLDRYLSGLALRRNRCIVVGGGDEGNAAGHYEGNPVMMPGGTAVYEDAELLVGDGEEGLYLEIWGEVPGVYTVSVTAPSGETIPEIPYQLGRSAEFRFVYADTRLRVEYVLVEQGNGQQLITLRFSKAMQGIWRIRVYCRRGAKKFHIWLPMTNFRKPGTYFLRPDPYSTLTEPAYSRDILSVSAYNQTDGSFYLNSGRGYAIDNYVTPVLAAPAINVPTPIFPETGSFMAAAIAAGAAADFLQWAVIERNDILINTANIKQYMIRGANRRQDMYYPTREWGYGTLDLAGVFEELAGI